MLDTYNILLNNIDPLAYANAGEVDLVCKFLVRISILSKRMRYVSRYACNKLAYDRFLGKLQLISMMPNLLHESVARFRKRH
jgi:hypothetical protein